MPANKLPHIVLRDKKQTYSFTPGSGRNTPYTPVKNRESHGALLQQSYIDSIANLEAQYTAITLDQNIIDRGAVIEMQFSPDSNIDVTTLENKTSKIELLNVKTDDNNRPSSAVIYIAEGKQGAITKQIESYANPENRRGTPKFDQTEAFEAATLNKMWLDKRPLPADETLLYNWEVWLKTSSFERIQALIALLPNARISNHKIKFPEREICSITCSVQNLNQIHLISKCISGFRYLPTLPGFFDALPANDAMDWVEELNGRITYTPNPEVSVCILDTGLRSQHPLLSYYIIQNGMASYMPDWGIEDNHGHGTQMAGIALFGDLAPVLETPSPIQINHGVESVKVFPPTGSNNEDHVGYITAQAVAIAEINNPDIRRVFCMSWSMQHDSDPSGKAVMEGKPTPLSAKIDQLAFGVVDFDNWQIDDENKKLFVISAGNVRDNFSPEQYGSINAIREIEDPAQAWNALTVGAYTDKTFTNDPNYNDWTLLAGQGGLSARSRTSVLWGAAHWPTKPDIVLEGGNHLIDPTNTYFDYHEDTSILTTDKGTLFSSTRDTSPANAEAARLAALVMTEYPQFWPETVRCLMVHSAEWVGAMNVDFQNKAQKISHLRRFGYGVPQKDFLLNSFSNRPCVIIQDHLKPFNLSPTGNGNIIFGDLNHYKLPWPEEELQAIFDKQVKLRVTLSYFIEPSPSERPPKTKYNYASHGLKFKLKRPNESEDEFLDRIGREVDEDFENEENPDDFFDVAIEENDKWLLGPQSRDRGSIMSDIWMGTGSELATQNMIGIVPHGGWWKFRNKFPDNQKPRHAQKVRYALALSLITEEEIDLYTPITVQNTVEIET
jgi:hypothetical protein